MEFQIWTSEFWWDEATTHKEYGEGITIDRQTREGLSINGNGKVRSEEHTSELQSP